MTPNEYQDKACRTLSSGEDRTLMGQDLMYVWGAFGLAGESGETADYIKKRILHNHGPVDPVVLGNELGDVMWYVATLAKTAGLTLEDIMANNVLKLEARLPNGWNEQDSKVRKEKYG